MFVKNMNPMDWNECGIMNSPTL